MAVSDYSPPIDPDRPISKNLNPKTAAWLQWLRTPDAQWEQIKLAFFHVYEEQESRLLAEASALNLEPEQVNFPLGPPDSLLSMFLEKNPDLDP